jgi:Flp pilus assembly pilin Flp
LIQKTEENVVQGRKCAQNCTGSSRDCYLSPDVSGEGFRVKEIFCRQWREDEGQDIAEYAVMLAVILVIVVGTIRLIGSSANNVFSSVASAIQ